MDKIHSPQKDAVKTISKTFENLGLPKEESLVYSSLLQKDFLSLTEIAKISGLKRTTLYPYIHKLLFNNFIERIPSGKRLFYKARNPKFIYKFYAEKVESFSKNLRNLESIFEEKNQQFSVRFYESSKGYEEVYKDMAESIDTIKTFFPTHEYMNRSNEHNIKNFETILMNYEGQIKDLAQDDPKLSSFIEKRKKWNKKNFIIKKLPPNFNFSVDFLVSGKKTAIFSIKKQTAILIKDQEIADFFKQIHDFFWKKL